MQEPPLCLTRRICSHGATSSAAPSSGSSIKDSRASSPNKNRTLKFFKLEQEIYIGRWLPSLIPRTAHSLIVATTPTGHQGSLWCNVKNTGSLSRSPKCTSKLLATWLALEMPRTGPHTRGIGCCSLCSTAHLSNYGRSKGEETYTPPTAKNCNALHLNSNVLNQGP